MEAVACDCLGGGACDCCGQELRRARQSGDARDILKRLLQAGSFSVVVCWTEDVAPMEHAVVAGTMQPP